jgi:hypothetical protein
MIILVISMGEKGTGERRKQYHSFAPGMEDKD